MSRTTISGISLRVWALSVAGASLALGAMDPAYAQETAPEEAPPAPEAPAPDAEERDEADDADPSDEAAEEQAAEEQAAEEQAVAEAAADDAAEDEDDGLITFGVRAETTRLSATPFDTAIGLTTVDRRQIDRHPVAAPGDLLSNQPGIWLNGEGVTNVTPIVRGVTGNQTLLLVDGVRINNGAIFGGPNSFGQLIDPADLDRVEVVRGPGSVLWGTDALGGIIHYIDRAPPDFLTTDGTRFGGRAAFTFGSYDNLVRYRGEGTVTSRDVRARVGGTFTDVGDLQTPNAVLTPSSFRSRSIEGTVDFRLNDQQVLGVDVEHHAMFDSQSYDISLNRPTISDLERLLVRVRHEVRRPVGFIDRLSSNAYVHVLGSTSRRIDDLSSSQSRGYTISAESVATSQVGSNFRVDYGLHVHHDILTSTNATAAGVLSRSYPDATFTNGALFGLADWIPIANLLRFQAGLRADVTHLATSPDMQSVPSGLTVDQLRLSQTNLAPTGSISAIVTVLPWLNLVATGGRGFRAPNVNDQVSSGAFRNGYNVPSLGIGPESSWNVEGGVRLHDRNVGEASITAFYTVFDNLIQQVRRNPDNAANDCVDVNYNMMCDANEYVYVRQNVGSAYATGVEASGSLRLPEGFTPYFSGTFMTGRTTPASGQGIALDRIIPANATIGLRFERETFYVDVFTQLVAPMAASELSCDRLGSDSGYRVDTRDAASPLLGSLTRTTVDGVTTCGGEFPGYATVGARAGIELFDILDLRLSASNLTNQLYRAANARIDGPGVGVFFTIGLHEPDAGQ